MISLIYGITTRASVSDILVTCYWVKVHCSHSLHTSYQQLPARYRRQETWTSILVRFSWSVAKLPKVDSTHLRHAVCLFVFNDKVALRWERLLKFRPYRWNVLRLWNHMNQNRHRHNLTGTMSPAVTSLHRRAKANAPVLLYFQSCHLLILF